MAVRWLKSMEIGVDDVDNQHKELFERVNLLLEACENGKGKDEVSSTIEYLQEYVVVHFATEEKLMKEYKYPDIGIHTEIHKDFVKDFLEFKKSFAEEGVTTKFIADFNKLVVNWLVKHIAEVDAKMGAFLEEEMYNNV